MPRTVPRVVADERERASGIPEMMRSMGVSVDYRVLDTGDYLVSSDTVVERKTLRDFAISIYDGRLFRQADRLTGSHPDLIYLIEGDLNTLPDEVSNPKVFWGAMASLLSISSLRTIFTPSTEGSAMALASLALHLQQRGGRTPKVFKRRRVGDDLRLQQLGIISSLPGIGEVLGRRLLAKFGSPSSVLSASTSMLASVEGVGRARAQRMRTVLDTIPEERKMVEQQRLGDQNG